MLLCISQEVAEKNTYTASEVGKVKVELNKVQAKLEQERSTQSDLREKLSSVDNSMSGTETDYQIIYQT